MITNCKQLVVLGGGSAGWLTALFLKKTYPNNDIFVIEDPNQPPIIAGESGGATLSSFYRALGIDISDWVRKVNAMPKLGSKFVDWDGVGSSFTHGLIDGRYNDDYSTISDTVIGGQNREFLSCAIAENISLENIFYCSKMINDNKLPIVRNLAIETIMWHFDSRANAEYMKVLGIARGIKIVEGKYSYSLKNDLGDTAIVYLEDGRYIQGDWFFDCSGFNRLLLQKEYNVESVDYTSLFPARNVVAWWDEDPKCINYTGITAMKYGWSWNINLKHRSGNGYIYDPDHITEDQAVEEINTRFNCNIDPVAKLSFTPSLLKTTWVNNVIAVGLSSGFLEPLEANGLSQVIFQLHLIEKYWNPVAVNDGDRRLFHEYHEDYNNQIVNFLSLHYKGHRQDTDFWLSHKHDLERTNFVTRERLDAWSKGSLIEDDKSFVIYPFESYATVVQGLGLVNLQTLKSRLIGKRATIFDDFYSSFEKVTDRNLKILSDSLTLDDWFKLTYPTI